MRILQILPRSGVQSNYREGLKDHLSWQYTSFIMADSAVESGEELHESEAVKASKLCSHGVHSEYECFCYGKRYSWCFSCWSKTSTTQKRRIEILAKVSRWSRERSKNKSRAGEKVRKLCKQMIDRDTRVQFWSETKLWFILPFIQSGGIYWNWTRSRCHRPGS